MCKALKTAVSRTAILIVWVAVAFSICATTAATTVTADYNVQETAVSDYDAQVIACDSMPSQLIKTAPRYFTTNLYDEVVDSIAFTWKRSLQFVKDIADLCWDVYLQFGIPPEFTMSLLEQESGNLGANLRPDGSKNVLVLWYYNLFGMKAHPGAKPTPYWDGRFVEIPHKEGDGSVKMARFRVYDSFEDSVFDWAYYVSSRPWYKDAWSRYEKSQLFTDFIKGFEPSRREVNGKETVEPGYSTDPHWGPNILKRIYEDRLSVLFDKHRVAPAPQ